VAAGPHHRGTALHDQVCVVESTSAKAVHRLTDGQLDALCGAPPPRKTVKRLQPAKWVPVAVHGEGAVFVNRREPELAAGVEMRQDLDDPVADEVITYVAS
jgi:hypothetical protein